MKMTSIAAAMVAVLIGGCATRITYSNSPPTDDIGVLSRRVHFVKLMETVRDNWHQAPSPELKQKVERLMHEAQLRQECANRKCWLQYKNYRITAGAEFIEIEASPKLFFKIDIREPEVAAKLIYS
jgi:hypothetical protein